VNDWFQMLFLFTFDLHRYGAVLTFGAPRSGGAAPPPVLVRGCVVGADGRNSRVRELVFGAEEDAKDSSSSAEVEAEAAEAEAPEANVYYALSPNPPPGGGLCRLNPVDP
jgi:hypothetical protein